ncbi:MAG: Hsp20/alpha crystallin family protein [Proteobacteria bacterium]|nr:Hsp20/alpha crystallin family protein [Pseudomonadota bacterium]
MWTRWSELDRTFSALEDYRRRMDRLFDDYNRPIEERGFYGGDWPALNLYDSGGSLVLQAEVPGLPEDAIELTLNQDVLTLSGKRQVAPPAGYSVHRRERGSIEFSRSLALPCKINPEKVAATVKDGVLTVTLEKAAEAQPRHIKVKGS